MWRRSMACVLLVSCTPESANGPDQANPEDASAAVADASVNEAGASLEDADLEEPLANDAAARDAAGSAEDSSAPSADARASMDAAPAAPDGGEPQPSLDALLGAYRAWTPHEAKPEAISTEIAALCRAPSAAERAFAASEHGDYRYLQNWLNDSARQTFVSKQTPFPVGAAIVKEKLASGASAELVLVARGLMIKREAGFDPAHGDWQFGYWTATAGLISDRTTANHCGGCHAGAQTDFVYLDRSWRIDRDAGG